MEKLIRKSPFNGLLIHAEKVLKGIDLLSQLLKLYDEGKLAEFESLAEELYKLEHEADLIKGNLRNHLHRYVFLPVDKRDLLGCLKELDAVIDSAQDICVWLTLYEGSIPQVIQDKINELMKEDKKVVDLTVQALKKAIEYLRRPFLKHGLRKEVKKMLKDVHEYERVTDLVEREIGKTIFREKIEPVPTIVFLRLSELLGRIADHAANAGDFIRVMLAR